MSYNKLPLSSLMFSRWSLGLLLFPSSRDVSLAKALYHLSNNHHYPSYRDRLPLNLQHIYIKMSILSVDRFYRRSGFLDPVDQIHTRLQIIRPTQRLRHHSLTPFPDNPSQSTNQEPRN